MAYILNVKGVFSRSRMSDSTGGIMKKRDVWVRGFGGCIVLANLNTAELWAIYYGIKMAWENNKKNVILFSESCHAIDAIENPDLTYPMAMVVDMILMLLGEKWTNVEIKPTDANANEWEKSMADYYIAGEGGITKMKEPPYVINRLI